jgi:hypothetical protein
MNRRRDAIKPLQIAGPGRRRALASWASWALLVAAIGGVLVILLLRFTGSPWLAGGLVAFMLAYMAVMGWLAMRNIEGRR